MWNRVQRHVAENARSWRCYNYDDVLHFWQGMETRQQDQQLDNLPASVMKTICQSTPLDAGRGQVVSQDYKPGIWCQSLEVQNKLHSVCSHTFYEGQPNVSEERVDDMPDLALLARRRMHMEGPQLKYLPENKGLWGVADTQAQHESCRARMLHREPDDTPENTSYKGIAQYTQHEVRTKDKAPYDTPENTFYTQHDSLPYKSHIFRPVVKIASFSTQGLFCKMLEKLGTAKWGRGILLAIASICIFCLLISVAWHYIKILLEPPLSPFQTIHNQAEDEDSNKGCDLDCWQILW